MERGRKGKAVGTVMVTNTRRNNIMSRRYAIYLFFFLWRFFLNLFFRLCVAIL